MAGNFRIEHVSTVPHGYKVRTVRRAGHQVRIAFPPGRRVKGSGTLVEVLHPVHENPCRLPNPSELVVMMANPHNGSGSQLEGATEVCEGFRGAPCDHVETYQEPEPQPRTLGQLGTLVELRVKRPTGWKWGELDFKGQSIQMGGNAGARQIYFVGGNQKISRGQLTDLGVDNSKELIDLGDAMYIAYRQKKAQVDNIMSTYEHNFGEETGVRPRLIYDRRGPEPRLFLAGGEYTITPEGIHN
jgi:hypothetical protein